MSAHTDDDLERMQEVWEKFSGVEVTPENTQKLNKELLDAVSPQIAVRTIREAAADAAHDLFDNTDSNVFEAWLWTRAERMEDATRDIEERDEADYDTGYPYLG